ncbi:hypothetical protein CLV32_1159 [Pedobacter duraquae]|uniref:Uncharacterized protein n=1 Tax=Pedobacter duraquae TaxID=425511 RepID=A0A4R6ISJ9_9SPHI|nr:hypothetical protein CLV32_1159 [Pedobacter duraquae]
MKILFILLLISCSTTSPKQLVYICNSGNATKYHYSATCRGLGTCQYKVTKISLEDAKSKGKTLCKWEGN